MGQLDRCLTKYEGEFGKSSLEDILYICMKSHLDSTLNPALFIEHATHNTVD